MYTYSNPIDYALYRIRAEIPIEILNMAFFPTTEHKTTDATNLNQRIREEVIDGLVMTAINNKGGKAISLDIRPDWIEKISPVTAIVHVPKTATQNRRITSVLNTNFAVSALSNAGAVGMVNQSSSYLNGANRAFRSMAPIPYVGTSNVEVVGENQLEISDFSSMPARIKMLVRIGYDLNFTDLRSNYWEEFCELTLLAVRGYCYNRLLGPMDSAFLQGGVELGRLSSKVDEWSDSMETFKDVLKERWGRITKLNDKIISRRNTSMITPG